MFSRKKGYRTPWWGLSLLGLVVALVVMSGFVRHGARWAHWLVAPWFSVTFGGGHFRGAWKGGAPIDSIDVVEPLVLDLPLCALWVWPTAANAPARKGPRMGPLKIHGKYRGGRARRIGSC